MNTLLPFSPSLSRKLLPLLACCLSVSALAQSFVPGRSYFGRSNYVEYIAGDLPLIISAPHGGKLRPAEIPDRKSGEFATDTCLEELARTAQQALREQSGHYPHVIICRLERRKVDCNREVEEGAAKDPGARQAWNEYHRFIQLARSNVLANSRAGFYIDLHGQSHPLNRIELGYCVTARQLGQEDGALNEPANAEHSSVRSLARRCAIPFAELLRGPNSLGALLVAKGYAAVPSPAMPNPGPGNPFFGGGYDTRRYGSAEGGAIDGLQMEVNNAGIRDTAANRTRFCRALAQVLDDYFHLYYDVDLKTGTAALRGKDAANASAGGSPSTGPGSQ